jgi:AhpD family alkylhydroperoxidase
VDATEPRRVDLQKDAPRAWSAMLRLDRDVRALGLEPTLLELVKTRCSQLNGCAYCIDMHTRDARAAGEDEMRLHLLAAWRESPCYTPRERAALALAEAITLLPAGVPDEVYDEARRHFDEPGLAALVWAAATINTWNRIAVTTRMQPGFYTPGSHA